MLPRLTDRAWPPVLRDQAVGTVAVASGPGEGIPANPSLADILHRRMATRSRILAATIRLVGMVRPEVPQKEREAAPSHLPLPDRISEEIDDRMLGSHQAEYRRPPASTSGSPGHGDQTSLAIHGDLLKNHRYMGHCRVILSAIIYFLWVKRRLIRKEVVA